jgi:ABC-type amino acid transport substrate-binding protein
MNSTQSPISKLQSLFLLRCALIIVLVMIGGGAIFVLARPLVIAQQRWDAIRAAGVLRVGIDPGIRPFSFQDANGWGGFDADVANEVAARLNLRVHPVPVGYDSFYDAITRDVVDLSMSALSPDAGKGADFVWSDAYVDAGVRLLRNDASRWRGMNDLQNAKLAAALGSEGDRTARWLERRVAGIQRSTVNDDAEAINSLRIGTFDAVLVDGASVLGTQCDPIAPREQTTCVAIQPKPYVIAARADGARMIDAINATLLDMQRDGTLNRLAQKWFAN